MWSRPLSLYSFSNCKISLTLPSPQFLEAVCCINPPEHWLNFYWRENLKWDLPFIRQMFNTNKNQFIFLLLLSIFIAVFFFFFFWLKKRFMEEDLDQGWHLYLFNQGPGMLNKILCSQRDYLIREGVIYYH